MRGNITFCENCRKDVSYSVEVVSMKDKLKGEQFGYNGQRATCMECDAEVYVADIHDGNLKAIYDSYRKTHHIIPHEHIVQIPQKYNIGKRPISLLLGWGEMTFTRYCDGDMPTKQYSDILQNIYDDPVFFLTILEQNKGNLKSSLAYEKSKKKTLECLGLQQKTDQKIDKVIHYLLFRCEDITPLALQKALYYIQGFYFAFMNHFLFDEDCEAWVHGPVYREIYTRYSSYRFDPIERKAQFDSSIFTDTEKAVIDSVIHNFCCYSGKILERFTHSEMPWLKARGTLAAETLSRRTIPKESIGEYFMGIKEKYIMMIPNDIENYAHVMFDRSIKS